MRETLLFFVIMLIITMISGAAAAGSGSGGPTAVLTPDSSRVDTASTRSISWPILLTEQFVIGNAGFAAGFWPSGGKKALHGFGNEANLSPLAGMIGVSLGVHFATSLQEERYASWRSCLVSTLGAFGGFLLSAVAFPQLYHGQHPTETYIVFSTAATLGAMLVYNLTVEDSR